ncbi:MAG TPA: biopolymer transporter ExbD [Candidatus Acidoferrales bacterium]|nr:biopolymer transporter ExbD [Candidatus Acidoferrales bacterium]
MGIQIGQKHGAMSEPNIVPLIDVLLVLIIIFMAITPTTPTGMSTLVPQPPPKNQKQNQDLLNKTIVVIVGKDGSVKINQTDSTWNDLGPTLTDIFKIRAEKVAFVKGDDDVPFDRVARAIDIMRGSGIVTVGLVTAKMEAEAGQ